MPQGSLPVTLLIIEILLMVSLFPRRPASNTFAISATILSAIQTENNSTRSLKVYFAEKAVAVVIQKKYAGVKCIDQESAAEDLHHFPFAEAE